jgi:hypothetical protein
VNSNVDRFGRPHLRTNLATRVLCPRAYYPVKWASLPLATKKYCWHKTLIVALPLRTPSAPLNDMPWPRASTAHPYWLQGCANCSCCLRRHRAKMARTAPQAMHVMALDTALAPQCSAAPAPTQCTAPQSNELTGGSPLYVIAHVTGPLPPLAVKQCIQGLLCRKSIEHVRRKHLLWLCFVCKSLPEHPSRMCSVCLRCTVPELHLLPVRAVPAILAQCTSAVTPPAHPHWPRCLHRSTN